MPGIAHAFDEGAGSVHRLDVERLRKVVASTGTAPAWQRTGTAEERVVPVHSALAPLLPGGMLARGTIVSLPHWVAPPMGGGCSYLALAMLAGATAGGSWVAAVNYPGFGIAAASGLGAVLSRILLVEAGERWWEAVALLAGAVDMVLVPAPERSTAAQERGVAARVRVTDRQRGCALLFTGSWPGAHLSMRIERPVWGGLGQGTGNLTGRRVAVVAGGRRAGGQEREVDVMLPDGDGALRPAVQEPGSIGVPELEDGRPPRLRIA